MSAVPSVPTPRRPRQAYPLPVPVEVVSTRAQKRARPKLVAVTGVVLALVAIIACQLLLTIATSGGAYEISRLQARQAEVAHDRQVLVEQIQVLEAPQHLAAEAQHLGMVRSSSAAYLRLSDAVVLGSAVPASASSALRTAPDGSPLIPDALLGAIPSATAPQPANDALGVATTAGVAAGATTAGLPGPASEPGASAATPAASTPTVGIPTPVTR